jgi:hypothetical protein
MDIHLKSMKAQDPRAIAEAIGKNLEIAAQVMDQGDVFTTILSFHTEQKGDIADARAMREHLAKQLTQVAGFLMLYGTKDAPDGE